MTSIGYKCLSSEQTQVYNRSVMSYQFTCKAILLISLRPVGLIGLRLHSGATEGSYSRDPVSQFDNSAAMRLWHRPCSSG